MTATAGLLSGRLALITGAGSGIGHAVCKAFAAQGARVAAVDVREQVHETLQHLAPGLTHKAYVADISNAEAVETLFKQVKNEFLQSPCCVVNCAGITRDKVLLKMTEKDFDDVINVNLKGTFLVTQMASKNMVQDKVKNGSIINISSIIGKTGNIGQCNYGASKAGVIGFTKSAAKELSRHGIRCNVVLPGFIDTPMTQVVPEKIMEGVISQIPMARMGTPAELANTCVYLASDLSSYVTGASIEVTGGLLM